MDALSRRSLSGPWIAIAVYLVFTVIAVVGFGTFGLHPQLLSGHPGLTSFYVVAFKFFAQSHVIVAAVVLVTYLIWRAGGAWILGGALIYIASLLSELAGTSTGLPFGSYSYSGLLGWKWMGLVPALIPLSWFLMALPAYVIARRRFPEALPQRVLLGAALLTAWDLALDPAMSGLTSYWGWAEAGPYYGMPLINLGGWMLTGVVLMALIHMTSKARWLDRLSIRWMAAYYATTILMPLGMLAAAGMFGAVVVSLAAAGGLLAFALIGRVSENGRAERVVRPAPGEIGPRVPEAATTDPQETLAFVRSRAEAIGGQTELLAFFRHHSRSFSFAARFFGDEERRLVAGLYAFCRTTDDFADRSDAPPNVIDARLDAWRRLVYEAYASSNTGIRWLDGIMSASFSRGVPFRLAEELIEGVRMDLDRVRIRTWDELDLYMYRVASVVGIWMCHLFGVQDAETHKRAAALGKAMQLTNILRDVGDDLAEDRIYLPREVMQRYGITEEGLRELQDAMQVDRQLPPAYRAMMDEMFGRAEALYENAHPGLSVLPPPFARAAAVASEVYRGIHVEIRRNAYDNLRRRAATSFSRKVFLAGRALLRPSVRHAYHPAPSREPVSKVGAVRTTTIIFCAAMISAAPLLVAAVDGNTAIAGNTRGNAAVHPAGILPTAPSADVGGDLGSECAAIEDVRIAYIRAVEHEPQIAETRGDIARCDAPVYRAYDGAFVTLKGKHAFWPPSKLKYVRRGLEVLDAQVRALPSNVEIRYLRLLSCYYLPGILGRGWSVDDDFARLAELLPEVKGAYPPELYETMVQFVLDHGEPTSDRRTELLAVLEASGVDAKS